MSFASSVHSHQTSFQLPYTHTHAYIHTHTDTHTYAYFALTTLPHPLLHFTSHLISIPLNTPLHQCVGGTQCHASTTPFSSVMQKKESRCWRARTNYLSRTSQLPPMVSQQHQKGSSTSQHLLSYLTVHLPLNCTTCSTSFFAFTIPENLFCSI